MAWNPVDKSVGEILTAANVDQLQENIEVHDHQSGRGAVIGLGYARNALERVFTTNAEHAVGSLTLPGDTLGNTGAVELVALVDIHGANWPAAPTWRLRYGSTVVCSLSPNIDQVGTGGFVVRGFLTAANSLTSAQAGHLRLEINQSSETSGAGANLAWVNSGPVAIRGDAAEDSTGDLLLSLTAEYSGQATTREMTVRNFFAVNWGKD